MATPSSPRRGSIYHGIGNRALKSLSRGLRKRLLRRQVASKKARAGRRRSGCFLRRPPEGFSEGGGGGERSFANAVYASVGDKQYCGCAAAQRRKWRRLRSLHLS
eukprot:5781089-Pyramimonas_sp.AAC.1